VVCEDSITDGYTYGQILMRALREAGKLRSAVICVGMAGDTATQMAARLELRTKGMAGCTRIGSKRLAALSR
jgi:hypothetical protein